MLISHSEISCPSSNDINVFYLFVDQIKDSIVIKHSIQLLEYLSFHIAAVFRRNESSVI